MGNREAKRSLRGRSWLFVYHAANPQVWHKGSYASLAMRERVNSHGGHEYALHRGGKYANITTMKNSRPISWIKAARKSFEDFPQDVQAEMLSAVTIAAEGGKADCAKPFKGLDGGVFEIVKQHRGDAYRAIYAVKIGTDVWVIHAFQKRSKEGIKTPRMEIDLIRDRLKRLKEFLQ